VLNSDAPQFPPSLWRVRRCPGGFSIQERYEKAGRSLSLSFGSRPHFACDHVFGLLASPTPELPHISGSPVGRLFHLTIASLQASFLAS
jgi:hypothetical protein